MGEALSAIQRLRCAYGNAAAGMALLPCFGAPLWASIFLATGPHGVWACLAWVLPMWATVLVDRYSPRATEHQAKCLPDWVFLIALYFLALMQAANILFLVRMASGLGFGSPAAIFDSLMNLFAIKVIVGTSSSFSSIVVAHELIHRRSGAKRLLGRFLLALTCYEHFSTEHLLGHHRRAGTVNDPATARYGETFKAYLRRSVVAQFEDAWRLEVRRLKRQKAIHLSWLRNSVLQGILFEVSLMGAIFGLFGWAALLAFLVQAYAAVQKLEAVNYIEHWGLSRSDGREPDGRAWDCDSWFTLHTLIGLPFHADHHRRPGKSYQNLRYCPESPRLPYGYFVMVFMAVWANGHFQALMTRELKRKRLGPFAVGRGGGAGRRSGL